MAEQTRGECTEQQREEEKRMDGFRGKELQCPHCNYRATRKYNLIRYLKRQHREILNLEAPTVEQHPCEFCGKIFTRKDNLLQHKRKFHSTSSYQCQFCKKEFQYEENYRQHNCQSEKKWKCPHCRATFTQEKNLKAHLKEHQQSGGGSATTAISSIPEVTQQNIVEPDEVASSASGMRQEATFEPQNRGQQNDLKIFFNETAPRLQAWLKQSIRRHKAVKWNVILQANLVMNVGGLVKEVSPIFKTKKEKPFVTTVRFIPRR